MKIPRPPEPIWYYFVMLIMYAVTLYVGYYIAMFIQHAVYATGNGIANGYNYLHETLEMLRAFLGENKP